MQFTGKMRRHARHIVSATTAGGLTLAALVAGAGNAHAVGPQGTLTGGTAQNEVWENTTHAWMGTTLMQIRPDAGGSAYVYCIERDTPTYIDRNLRYEAHEWATYERNANWDRVSGKVAWILSHSYPQINATQVLHNAGYTLQAGETVAASRIAAATQAAIWHYTQGFEPRADGFWTATSRATADSADPAATAVYDYLTTNATDVAPPKLSVSLTPNNPARDDNGLFAPITLKATNPATVNGTLPTGATLTIDGQETTLPATVVAGEHTLSLSVPPTTPSGSLDVKVSSSGVGAPVGTIWQSTGGNYQSLITASSTQTTAEASTTLSWTAPAPAPEPTPEPSAPAPSPEPTTPVSSPEPTPTTDAPSVAPTAAPTTPAETPVSTPTTDAPSVAPTAVPTTSAEAPTPVDSPAPTQAPVPTQEPSAPVAVPTQTADAPVGSPEPSAIVPPEKAATTTSSPNGKVTASATSNTTASAPTSSAPENTGTLPYTGAGTMIWGGVAFALISVGAAFLALGRRARV